MPVQLEPTVDTYIDLSAMCIILYTSVLVLADQVPTCSRDLWTGHRTVWYYIHNIHTPMHSNWLYHMCRHESHWLIYYGRTAASLYSQCKNFNYIHSRKSCKYLHETQINLTASEGNSINRVGYPYFLGREGPPMWFTIIWRTVILYLGGLYARVHRISLPIKASRESVAVTNYEFQLLYMHEMHVRCTQRTHPWINVRVWEHVHWLLN